MWLIYRASVLFLILTLIGGPVNSQSSNKPIGEWKNYLPYAAFNYVTQSEDQVFATSGLAVMAVDKQDYSKTFISKLNGLNSSGTTFIKYISSVDGLIVTYDDSEFDLVLQNRTLNYDNIKVDGTFFNREILNVSVIKDDVVYFCTAFGLIEFFPDKEEFGFTLNLGEAVYGLTYLDNHYYAATEFGIYKAEDNPLINLKDLTNWELLDAQDGFPDDYIATKIATFQDEIVFASDSVLYRQIPGGIDTLLFEPGFRIQYISTEGPNMIVGQRCKGDCDGRAFLFETNWQKREFSPESIDRPLYAIEDQYGQVWAADVWLGLRRGDINDPGFTDHYVNSQQPIREAVFEIALRGDEIWLTSNGLRTTDFNPQINFWGVLGGIDGEWKEYNPNTVSGLEGQDGIGYHRILADPNTGNIYVGTNSQGLVIMDAENNFSYLDDQNSNLDYGADPNRIRVAGLALDDAGNLWMANNTATNPIVVLTPDGNTINEFSNQVPFGSAIRDVAIDFSGYKWFTVDKNGLMVYDDNGTLNSNSDDRVRNIKTTNSLLPDNFVRCIEVDLEGEVWVGTLLGVISFNCGSGVFEAADCQGFLQVVEVDGFRANLLETEEVRAIAVDGANRKWFGTTNGVFLMSPNGKEQLAFFNTDNSPLPDNFINDIKIHPETGEVFIATGKGLVSYRGESTSGARFHNEEEAFAYPNPVRPDYRGPIAIKGLTRDADIKITDVNGQLVYQTQALGGQAIWDGNDYNGRRASSGVYYVYSTSNDELDQPNTLITKLLFIN